MKEAKVNFLEMKPEVRFPKSVYRNLHVGMARFQIRTLISLKLGSGV